MKFPPTTSHERFLRSHWDLGTHGGGKECLTKTSRPGFVSTVRPDLSQSTHRLKEEDWGHPLPETQDQPSPSEVQSPQR